MGVVHCGFGAAIQACGQHLKIVIAFFVSFLPIESRRIKALKKLRTARLATGRCLFVMMARSCRRIANAPARPTIALRASAALLGSAECYFQQFANGIRSRRNFFLHAAPVFDLRKDRSL
jgi:hypothetical protein